MQIREGGKIHTPGPYCDACDQVGPTAYPLKEGLAGCNGYIHAESFWHEGGLFADVSEKCDGCGQRH